MEQAYYPCADALQVVEQIIGRSILRWAKLSREIRNLDAEA